MVALSIIIPARNEEFLKQTVESILKQMRGATECIVISDGCWPSPPIQDHPKVQVIHHTEAVGQRAATNNGAKLSRAKYLMKLDAHCNVAEGFDVKLMAPYESGEIGMDVTTIPRLFNLHAFDWQCNGCGHRLYQRPKPDTCEGCKQTADFTRVMVWQPRLGRRTDFARLDTNLQFQYWKGYDKRPVAQGDIADVMTSVGACWFMPAERFWQLGGMDEAGGIWGQYGCEIALKSWLSGGRHVVNKRTWYSHMFRSQWRWQGLWPISQQQIDNARAYSRNLWLTNGWIGQTRPLAWVIEKFSPLPGWHDPEGAEVLATVMKAGEAYGLAPV